MKNDLNSTSHSNPSPDRFSLVIHAPHVRESGVHGMGVPSPAFVGPGPDLLAADRIEGEEVYNYQRHRLGTIRHVMLDVLRGRIGYGVLTRGGVLGIGDRLLAVPWAALTVDLDHDCFLLDASESQIESAPSFDKSHWPSMADLRWATQIHMHYGLSPYWE